jgi:hypothetical protein
MARGKIGKTIETNRKISDGEGDRVGECEINGGMEP